MDGGTAAHKIPVDAWTNGEAYERYVGRWSRLVAPEFLSWLAVPPNRRWLDIGCGTGTLSREILGGARPAAVYSIDRSPAYAAFARHDLRDGRAGFAVGDVRAIPLADAVCDAVVSGLMLNFVPAGDQAAAAAELCRVTRPGGIVAVYVWDYAGEMQMMRHFWGAVASLQRTARTVDEAERFPLCQPEPLAGLFRGAGLDPVVVRSIDVPTIFQNFADYWQPFLGGQGSAPSYVASLPADQREALRHRLDMTLPRETDGTIRLIARAWAVKGIWSGAVVGDSR